MIATDIIKQLGVMFDAINERYYDGELPEAVITIKQGKTEKQSVYGTFTPSVWAKYETEVDADGERHTNILNTYHEIAIASDALNRPIPNIACTMAHEMVHLYCAIANIKETSRNDRYHNKKFKALAERSGLVVSEVDKIGWSKTDPSFEFTQLVNDMNLDESVFEYYRNTCLVEKVKKVSAKKRFVCPICGMTINAKQNMNIVCGDCMLRMDYWDIGNDDEGIDPVIIDDYNNGLSMTEDGFYHELG